MNRFEFSHTAIDIPAAQATLADPVCGGYAAFEGWVRNHNEGLAVRRLEYEAFEALAVKEGERIVAEAQRRFGVEQARCIHRIGDLTIGDLAVWVGVSARHRDEAFRACRYIIDEVKHRVPIWKKEHYENGDSGWVNCERCATAPRPDPEPLAADAHADTDTDTHTQAHPHSHAHAHSHADSHVNEPAPAPDYSRQMALPDVGARGQAALRASHVAVIGAGGLGVPVLQYLAGAGVGALTVVDGDRLEASNLHRQTWYQLADCGQPKAELAATRVRALNPQVRVQARAQRLDAANGADWLADADLIVDCTDNFGSKFLLNDLAVTLRKPVLFASVYQYEGQLQMVRPDDSGACLRCLWPQATRDGLVGNCAEAGVLGPVPGVFGSLQALEALKHLLGLPGRLRDELLMMDLLTFSVTRVRARRAGECTQAPCGRIDAALQSARSQLAARRAADSAGESIETQFDSIDAARRAGFAIVDVREALEVAAAPIAPAAAADEPPVQVLPLSALLEGAAPRTAEGPLLMVCARGQRSLTAAQALRERGLARVFSLRGGLAGLPDRAAN